MFCWHGKILKPRIYGLETDMWKVKKNVFLKHGNRHFLKRHLQESSLICREYVFIKATVVYRCSKVTNQSRDNKSGLQTKTEGNSSTIREKHLNNRNTEVNKKQSAMQHTQKQTIR